MIAGILWACAGCACEAPAGSDVILLVSGVSGDGFWYSGAARALAETRPGVHVERVAWGAPLPLFFLNFNSRSIHDDAERDLAARIRRIHERDPDARIDIVAHSAGCGVALGALEELDEVTRINRLILLAPSVSPAYDLAAAAVRARDGIDVFYGDRDQLFLNWRTRTFGTYDNVKTPAAGNLGFELSPAADDVRARIRQHPYEQAWESLGNDGGHFGWLARRFVEQEIVPLLR